MVNMKFDKSIHLLQKALKIIPIGAQTYSKSYRYFTEDYGPFFTVKGNGAFLHDLDGNKYLDFICSLGAITLGYNFKPTNSAIKKQLKKGIIFSTQSPLEVELADKLVEIIPGAESVKFLKNGSDATSTAVRLARAFTNKDVILMSGYHGMDDWSIGTTENDRGIPSEVKSLTDTFQYNNIKDIEQKFQTHKGNVAAVILEPIQGLGPQKNYLEKLKELTNKNKALLIFDEVVSGFRYALGGAAELYKVVPDLAAYGKGMANGMPISAVTGKKEILDAINQNVFVSTTFGGETLSLASAISTINYMEKNDTQKHIKQLGDMYSVALQELIKEYDLNDIVSFYGFGARNGIIFKDYNKTPAIYFQSYYQKRMLDFNILTYTVVNFMHSHTPKHINALTEANQIILKEIKALLSNEITIHENELIHPIFTRNT